MGIHPKPRRWARVLLCAGLLGLAGMQAQAQVYHRPPAGVDVDRTRTVDLPARVSARCVAVALPGATVQLPLGVIEALANARPAGPYGAPEHRALAIDARRAQSLLAIAVPAPRKRRCATLEEGQLQGPQRALVLDFIERGQAAVVDTATGRNVRRVEVHYLGQRCGPMCGRGHILVRLPRGERPFLAVDWWVS